MYSVVTTNTNRGSVTFCLVFSKVIFVQFCKVWNALKHFCSVPTQSLNFVAHDRNISSSIVNKDETSWQ